MKRAPKYARNTKHRANPLLVAVGICVMVLSVPVTALQLRNIATIPGTRASASVSSVKDVTLMERFDSHVEGAVTDVLSGLSVIPAPEETVPEETRPVYEPLSDADLVAPEPDQSRFGETENPGELGWLLQEAAWILDGQSTYFHTGVEIYEGSKVTYYLDDTIFAVTWKEVHDGSVYTFSEVKIADPSQFRRFLADGVYGSDKQYMTTEMAQSVNAVVASSGDFYRFRNFGICVYEGQVRKVEGTYAETCYIDVNGDMLFTYGGDILTTASAQTFVDENNIRFSLCFGPVMVDNYELVDHTWYGVGEINEGYARAALCQMDTLHYIVATANTEGVYQQIPTVATFQKNIAATGCRMAYCLDGGQTAAIVMNDQLINRPVYGSQRLISDIIYFATAVPDGG